MNDTLTAALLYAAEVKTTILVLYGLLAVACVVLCASLALFVNLRIRAHVDHETIARLQAELAAANQAIDTEHEKRRKLFRQYRDYHRRAEAALKAVESGQTGKALAEVIKLVPRPTKSA